TIAIEIRIAAKAENFIKNFTNDSKGFVLVLVRFKFLYISIY
mgnify:CR=1